MTFSGSYDPADVTFLLKPARITPTPVAEKERLLQSGERHYSEMIGVEYVPSVTYLSLFHEAVERERGRMATDIVTLAALIAASRQGPITLVSLARAGTPIGVLLGRVLRMWGRAVAHYSVSIIRDRGIDEQAVSYVLARHSDRSIVFIDGWTGKGVIAAELHRSIDTLNLSRRIAIDPGLYVLADLCGSAAAAATDEDYLLPSSLLGATVSGLISRSVLNRDVVAAGEFHACVYYEELKTRDLSRWFVDTVWAEIKREKAIPLVATAHQLDERQALRRRVSADFLRACVGRFGLDSIHFLKPGVGEATRVLLRRVPRMLLLRDREAAETRHLRLLAHEKGVPVMLEPDLPYRAAAIIKELEQ